MSRVPNAILGGVEDKEKYTALSRVDGVVCVVGRPASPSVL